MNSEPIQPRPEVALAAVLYLMTRYQRVPCPAVARAIADHLNRLARNCGVDDCIRSLCVGLRDEWERAAFKGLLERQGTLIH